MPPPSMARTHLPTRDHGPGAGVVRRASAVHYPEPPPELSGGWLRLARVFGPGVVIASVTVGTGETIFSPRLGAIFGYAMLWVILAAVICKGVLVYSGGRHLVLTGEHPMEAWARLPGPHAWLPWIIGAVAAISFPLWVAALTDAVSSLLVWMTGIGQGAAWGRPAWSTVIILAAMTLAVLQTYNIIERVSTAFLALKILFIFAAIVVVRPDWFAALAGLVTPRLPAYEPWVAASYPDIAREPTFFHVAVFLGVIGGGIQDYLGYVGMMREKAWGLAALPAGAAAGGEARLGAPGDRSDPGETGETGFRGATVSASAIESRAVADASSAHLVLPQDEASVARARRWLWAPRMDVVFSFACVLLLTSCFMILGAAVLHPLQQVPTDRDLYSQQSRFLAVVHPALVSVYKAGIFFAMFGAIYGTFEIYARTAYEWLRAVRPTAGAPRPFERVRFIVTLYAGLGALILLWTGLQTVMIVKVTSPLSGVFGCGLWCLAMLWVDRTQMPKPYRMHPLFFALTALVGLAMAGAGAYTTYRNWM